MIACLADLTCRSSILTVFLILSLTRAGASQMMIEDFDARRHNRFVADRGGIEFIGDVENIDLSGVGRVNEGAGRWVTMVSPTHFLTSNHAIADQGTVTFFRGNELDSATVTCGINPESGRRIGDTDLWIGSVLLDADCDTSVLTFYDIASPGDYVGRQVVVAGQSDRTLGERTTNMRVGRNAISYVETGTFFRGTADHLVSTDDSLAGDVRHSPAQVGSQRVDSEHRLSNGDSGAPTFIRSITGDYELIGLHSYLGYDGQQQDDGFKADRWASIDTYLPTERNLIYEEVRLDDPGFSFVRNLDGGPVGDAPGRDFFVIESGFDCNLDGAIGPEDLDCTDWAGALTDVPSLLAQFDAPLGDIDLDGKVGFTEFLQLTRNFNKPGIYRDGDFTLDGFIDFGDFLILTRNFGAAKPPSRRAEAVPEPSAFYATIWFVCVLVAIRRRTHISR